MNYEITTTCSNNLEKWHYQMEWCRKAGFSPYNDVYWELAEREYAQRHFENSIGSDIPQIPLPNKIKEKDE